MLHEGGLEVAGKGEGVAMVSGRWRVVQAACFALCNRWKWNEGARGGDTRPPLKWTLLKPFSVMFYVPLAAVVLQHLEGGADGGRGGLIGG